MRLYNAAEWKDVTTESKDVTMQEDLAHELTWYMFLLGLVYKLYCQKTIFDIEHVFWTLYQNPTHKTT